MCGYIKLLKMIKNYAFRTTKNMSKVRLYELGVNAQPKHYPLFKMFSPHIFNGTSGRGDSTYIDDKFKNVDRFILERFY
jgi:hypothetical protein